MKFSENIFKLFSQYVCQFETNRGSNRDRAGPEYSQGSSNYYYNYYEGVSGSKYGEVPGGVPFPGTGGKVRVCFAKICVPLLTRHKTAT